MGNVRIAVLNARKASLNWPICKSTTWSILEKSLISARSAINVSVPPQTWRLTFDYIMGLDPSRARSASFRSPNLFIWSCTRDYSKSKQLSTPKSITLPVRMKDRSPAVPVHVPTSVQADYEPIGRQPRANLQVGNWISLTILRMGPRTTALRFSYNVL
jgi:hypothetical protein